ncbi:MAG: PDZ domain-containing protein [Chitinispirillales bacterium]|jgi:carboxyl-terminal processing protease|nr:PDZ domain-containing protein [Chitinispirillales bacterium]
MLRRTSAVAVGLLALMFLFVGGAIGEERFGGVGLQVKTEGGELIVVDVLAGSDALAKGVLSGDVITKIDKLNTNGIDFETLVGKLRGSVGSEVVLEVKRDGAQKPLTFKVKRAEVVYPG